MAEYDFGGSFLRGMTGTADMINADKRVQIMQEEEARAKTEFDQKQQDRNGRRASARLYALMWDPETNTFDLNRATAAIRDLPGFDENMGGVLRGGKFDRFEQDPENPGHMVVHVTDANGNPDFLTDENDSVVSIPKKNLPAHILGYMAENSPELADKLMKDLAAQADDQAEKLLYGNEFDEAAAAAQGQSQGQPQQQGPTSLAAAAGVPRSTVPGAPAPGPQPAAPAAAPRPQPAAQPASELPSRSLAELSGDVYQSIKNTASGAADGLSSAANTVLDTRIGGDPSGGNPYAFTPRQAGAAAARAANGVLDTRVGGDPSGKNPYAFSLREAAEPAVSAAGRFVDDQVSGAQFYGRAAKGLYDSAVDWTSRNVVEPLAERFGKPATETPAPPTTNPVARQSASQVSAADVARRAAERPAPRDEGKPAAQRSAPSVAQSITRNVDPKAIGPKVSKKEFSESVNALVRLHRAGRLTSAEVKKNVDRMLGRPTQQVTVGGKVLNMDENGQVLSMIDPGLTQKDLQSAGFEERRLALQERQVQAAEAEVGIKRKQARDEDVLKISDSIATSMAGTGKDRDDRLYNMIKRGLPNLMARYNMNPNAPETYSVVDRMVRQIRADQDRFGFWDDKTYDDYDLETVYAASKYAGVDEPIRNGFEKLNNMRVGLDKQLSGMSPSQINDATSLYAERLAQEKNIGKDRALGLVRQMMATDAEQTLYGIMQVVNAGK